MNKSNNEIIRQAIASAAESARGILEAAEQRGKESGEAVAENARALLEAAGQKSRQGRNAIAKKANAIKKEQEISAIKRKAKKVIVNGQEGLEKYKSNQSIVGTVATDIYYDLENLGASINDLSLVELRVLCDECISHIAERKTSDNVNRASRKLENSELTIIYDKAAETYAEFMDIVCNLDEYQLRCNSCKYYHHSTCMRAHGPQSGQRVLPTDGCNRHEVDTER